MTDILIEKYLGEAKMGKSPGKVKRTVLAGTPFTLIWELINPDVSDEKTNYKYIEDLAYGELMSMKRKKILDFHESDFSVSVLDNMRGEKGYVAEVKLRTYDNDKLMKELRRLKFKTIR